MNTVSYFLIGTGLILVLLLASAIFYDANFKWRANPARPLFIGIALLIAAFAVDLFMSVTSVDIKAFVDSQPPTLTKEAVEVFLATALANDWLAKMMELIVIPLAVAIIATALIARVDLDLENVQEEFNKADARISELEDQKKQYTDTVDRGLRNGVLDAPVLDAYNKLKTINSQLLDEREKFREEFRKLTDSGFRHRFRRKKR